MSQFFIDLASALACKLNNRPIKMRIIFDLFIALFIIGLASTPSDSKAEDSLDGIWSQNNLFSKTASTQSFNAIKLLANTQLLSQKLSQAPDVENKALGHEGIILYLPLDDGSFSPFEIFKSKNLIKQTSKTLTKTQTYKAFGIERPELIGHLDFGIRGFHAMILGADKPIYIDPNFEKFKKEKKINPKNHRIPNEYNAFKLDKPKAFQCGFKNHATHLEEAFPKIQNDILARQNGTELLTYRIAVTTSAEYADAVSSEGTDEERIDETLSAIETAINRINVIYNQDLSIQLELIKDERLIILNPALNPFTNDANSDINIVTSKINNMIGSQNYDIGHLFTVSGGGLAFFQSVCDNKIKGKGVTGVNINELESDAFYIDYVAHEIGHQFGANHSFNGTTGSCKGNRNSSTAFEPGSGSTIMAYAGICGAESLQNSSDPYFHTGSIDEILSFVNNSSSGGSCKSVSTNSDNPPTVDAGDNYIIPANTPFKLSASGNDIDEDAITYTWEQMDTGTATSSQSQMKQDNGSRTLFRSFIGTTNPTRYFPSFDDVLDNTLTIGETYPTTTRQLSFRVTARSGFYGTATNNEKPIIIQSTDTGSAFSVIEPQANSYHFESSNMTVLWETARTEKSPINCSDVDILLANDGGINYESFTPLLNNTPNDGLATVLLPAGITSTARLLIQCSDNIFYNINNGEFNIINSTASLFSIAINDHKQNEGNSKFKSFIFTITRSGNFEQSPSVNFKLKGYGINPTNDEDFIAGQDFSGSLNFSEEEVEKTITIQTKGDTSFEENEQFSILLSSPNNAFISTATAIATIINDDIEPSNTIIEKSKNNSSKGSFYYLEILFLALFIRARKGLTINIFVLFSFLAISCSHITQNPIHSASINEHEESKNNPPQVEALLWVNNANADADAKKAIREKEFIFLASEIKGQIFMPGLDQTQKNFALQQTYKSQEGMGDLIVSEEHQQLRNKFLAYAAKYNQILAQYLLSEKR